MDETVEGEFSFGRYVQAVWLQAIVGAGLLVFGVAALLSRGPKSPESALELLPLLGPIALIGAVALVWCAVQFARRTSELKVGPAGMAWVAGGRAAFAAWSDVSEVYRDDIYTVSPGAPKRRSEWARRAHVRVVFQNGTEVTFRQTLSNYDALVSAIQRYAAEAVYAAKLQEVADRGEAGFGRVVVSPAGLRVGKRFYPWAETNYAVSQGWLCLVPARDDFQIEERKEVALSTIPNYVALLVLMGQVGKPPVDPLLTYPVRWRANMARRL